MAQSAGSESERMEREYLEGLRYDDKFPDDEALQFASYCPHCHTGDPGEDYCASCGESL